MTTLEEHVARAIFRTLFHPDEDADTIEKKWREWDNERNHAIASARAAIAAVRENETDLAGAMRDKTIIECACNVLGLRGNPSPRVERSADYRRGWDMCAEAGADAIAALRGVPTPPSAMGITIAEQSQGLIAEAMRAKTLDEC